MDNRQNPIQRRKSEQMTHPWLKNPQGKHPAMPHRMQARRKGR